MISQSYFKHVSKFKLLTKEQEIELANKIKFGDKEAREKLFNSNLSLVIKIAKSYNNWKNGLELSDLIQQGNIGLIQAVDRFDPTKNIRFANYAAIWIKAMINESYHEDGKTIRIPPSRAQKISKINSHREKFIEKYNREPTLEELAKIEKITPKKLNKLISNKVTIYSLNAPISAETDNSLDSFISSEIKTNFEMPEDNFISDSREDLSLALAEVSKLPSNEKTILVKYFGLNGEDAHTFREIGEIVKLPAVSVRYIMSKSLKKLKSRMLS